jgi:hypothetical protein
LKATAAFRGQPLLVLVGLLGAWLALRVAVWQPSADATILAAPNLRAIAVNREHGVDASDDRPLAAAPHRPVVRPTRFSFRHALPESWPRPSAEPGWWIVPTALVAANDPVSELPTHSSPARLAVGHTLLLAAGLSQLELPPALAAYFQDALPARPGVPAAAPALAGLPQPAAPFTGSRWSADAWLMVRQDTTAAIASGRPSYGRSQAGAVVRYRLAPASAHAPQAYMRASSALAGPLERDVVAGFSGRPLPRVPLRVALEARVSQTAQGIELRPAAIAVTELPPVGLPRGLRAEAYLQGGYVGGKFAMAFVDGQGRVERTVARLGQAEVTAGAGAWGGAQKGTARLDIGPTAAVSFRLGDARGRVAADYRFRIAGDAEPRSGPALTLSAGF